MDEVNLPTFETDRLVLRPMVKSDSKNIRKYGEDREVYQHMADKSYFYDEKWIAGHQKSYSDRVRATLAITLKTDTAHAIGLGHLVFDQKYKQVAEVGYWIAKHMWGQGIVSEAAKRLLEWGFNDLKCVVIYARCVPVNIASIKIAEKLGMKYEGCLRSRLQICGKFADLNHYSILRSEFYEKMKRDEQGSQNDVAHFVNRIN